MSERFPLLKLELTRICIIYSTCWQEFNVCPTMKTLEFPCCWTWRVKNLIHSTFQQIVLHKVAVLWTVNQTFPCDLVNLVSPQYDLACWLCVKSSIILKLTSSEAFSCCVKWSLLLYLPISDPSLHLHLLVVTNTETCVSEHLSWMCTFEMCLIRSQYVANWTRLTT